MNVMIGDKNHIFYIKDIFHVSAACDIHISHNFAKLDDLLVYFSYVIIVSLIFLLVF